MLPVNAMLLSDVLDTARVCGDIGALSISQFCLLFSLVSHLYDRLCWHRSPDSDTLPVYLPPDVAKFLCKAIDVDEDTLFNCWDALRSSFVKLRTEDSDMSHSPLRNVSLLPLFLQVGLACGIGIYVNSLLIYVF